MRKTGQTRTRTPWRWGAASVPGLDAGSFNPCDSESSQSYSNLQDGQHTFTVKATDRAGNQSTAGRTWTVNTTPIDNMAPTLSITSHPSDPTNQNDTSFAWTGSDDVSQTSDLTYSANLDDGGWSPLGSQTSFAWYFPEGIHTVSFKAVDQAGNESDPVSYTWKVDNTAPQTPVISSPAEGARLNSSSFSVSGTSEPNSTVDLFSTSTKTTQADSSGNWSVSLSGVANGSQSYRARATDPAGNTSATSAARTVTVNTASADTTAPTVKSVSPSNLATGVSPGTNVTATFSEAMSPTSINKMTFKLYKKSSTTPIAATVSYDPVTHRAILNPTNNLRLATTYKALITTGVKDTAGNPLAQNKVWYFTIKR